MLLMFKYLLTNLKKRNIFLTYHAIAVALFTFIYFIIARYIGVTDDDHTKLGDEKQIINFNKLKDINFDFIIILAWNFSDAIIKKLKKNVKNRKFKIIIPFPNLKVV